MTTNDPKGLFEKKFKVTLVDCVQRHKEHPKTFGVPSLRERQKLVVGGFAKICLENIVNPKNPWDEKLSERPWVEIVEKTETGYVVTMGNDLVRYPWIEYGQIMTIEFRHIMQTDVP